MGTEKRYKKLKDYLEGLEKDNERMLGAIEKFEADLEAETGTRKLKKAKQIVADLKEKQEKSQKKVERMLEELENKLDAQLEKNNEQESEEED